ncbi:MULTISPECIES: SDR family oxidoreductase [Acidianus]|uniref:Short-chain dehydrogenase n=1 Tax=Candidatus Acidianus copahuensis TaxID=1160895 RepID=A0A031LLH5_9CREN|nr:MULTISPECIES: SDR family oxidoreductase [Acidianus]EZQ02089.1 short-chain dehydrogenase [Candidatus Acidianus copahuensis]NON63558.1 SDR family oxidoreductase [Acidianus sp. RZ1]
MDLGIKEKKVVVTASSKGIGFAIAKRFLEEGSIVVISSHDEKNLQKAYEKLKEYGNVKKEIADLSNPNSVKNLIRKSVDIMGGLDVLVYVTGSPKPGDLLSLKDEDWSYAFNLLLMSAVVAVREAGNVMGRGGRIILSTSMTLRQPIDNLDLSNVVRLSLAGLVKSASREFASKGILVNGVMPGWIFTDRVKQLVKDRSLRENKSEEEVLQDITKDIPLGRIGQPEELANVVLFLASSLSTYITGSLIPVDGGVIKAIF